MKPPSMLLSWRSRSFGMLAIGVALSLFACSGSSGDGSATGSDSGSGQGDEGGVTNGDGGTGTEGGARNSDGGNPLPAAFQWHVGGLTEGQQYESLVASADKIFAVQEASDVIVYGFTTSGNQLFATDITAALGTTITAPAKTALAIETDGTLLVTVLYDGSEAQAGTLVKLNADGSIAWHLQPTITDPANPGGLTDRAALTHPAIASDGTIYIVTTELSASSDGLERQLLSISPAGVLNFAINLAYSEQSPHAPWIAPNGNVGVLITQGSGQSIAMITPGTQAITTVALDATLQVDSVTPLADGTWLASVFDDSRMLPACAGDEGANSVQPEEARYAADGSLMWHTDIVANELSSQIVTGAGTDALVAWGNCMDGTGAGLYTISQTTGAITQTFGNTFGDGLAVLGGSTDAFLLVQNDMVSGVETGPVVEAVNRTTGTADAVIGVPCAAPGHANNEYAEMTIVGSNTLIVSCSETAEIPGGGGLYALKMPVSTASDSTWPFVNENALGTRNLGP